MTTHHARTFRPTVRALEGRVLLSGPSARWIGQDGHDYVGQAHALGGNGVQDIRFALDGLPTGKAIAWIDVQGLGGGDWQYRGGPSTWAVALGRDAGSASADLYVEPYQYETGRPFDFDIVYDDGSRDNVWSDGGNADPNLRMPSSSARLAWGGQDGADRAGPGPAVGPDGIQDLHLVLSNLSTTDPLVAVTLVSSGGLAWGSGANPAGFSNLEVRGRANDPSTVDLDLSPLGDLDSQVLTATIDYASGKSDTAVVVAQHTDPTLAAPPSAGAVPMLREGLSAAWIGQDGQDLVGPGAARIALGGLPAGRTVIAAALSDESRSLWVYRSPAGAGVYSDSWTEPMAYRPTAAGGDVSFAPLRNEVGATLTVRLVFDDGSMAIARLTAGATDPARRSPLPAPTSVVAHPGDDLNTLANGYGTVRLSAGIYDLNRPLVLNNPVTLTADPGAIVRFSQGLADPAWSAAIKIQAGHTTLSGFAVRFATPIRWADGVSYGPAVIGTTDNLDSGPAASQLKAGLVLSGLDLESPPVPDGPAVEAPRLIRLVSGLSGTIAGNTLKGGSTEFLGGPWTITQNRYLGTVPNTFTWAAFAGHSTRDVVLSGNTAQPVGPSGRTWRFLVLTGTGTGDVVSDNQVVGIGPRDGDTIDANAAELILTESYALDFEGMPTSISSDGKFLRIPTPQNGPAQTGDVVAILSGPNAGQYRRIAQAIGPQTYLMDDPLPAGSYAVSIAPGFVAEKFLRNTVDARGGGGAGDMVFVGNHFGTTIAGNHLLGGAQGLLATAAPSEHPDPWGWSHAPFLGASITGNTFEDSAGAATLAVEHSSAIKTNSGRVYFSGALTNNTVVWTAPFLAARGADLPSGLTVGAGGSLDPNEIMLTTSANIASFPAGSAAPALHVIAGNVNGTAMRDKSTPLSPPIPPPTSPPFGAPPNLRLVNDTGVSDRDLNTADGRVTFDAVAGAVGYEYLVSGNPAYLPLAGAGPFLPAGLVQVSNTITVRAIDAQGRRSAESWFQIMLDNEPPSDSIPFLRPSDDTGASALDRITRVTTPSFNITGEMTDTMILYRDGQEIGRLFGPGVLTDASPRPDGTYAYRIRRIDAAGNAADSASVALTIDATPPPAVGNLTVSPAGAVSFLPTGPDDRYEYRIGDSGAFRPLDRTTSFGVPAGSVVTVRAVDLAGNYGPETSSASGGSAPVVKAPVATAPSTPATPKRKAKKPKRLPKPKAHIVAEAHPKGPGARFRKPSARRGG